MDGGWNFTLMFLGEDELLGRMGEITSSGGRSQTKIIHHIVSNSKDLKHSFSISVEFFQIWLILKKVLFIPCQVVSRPKCLK